MKDRIQINGVWYVKEDSAPEPTYPIFCEDDITWFQGCTYETDDYCWEVTKIQIEENKYHNGVNIKFTNKTTKETQHWDNDMWLMGVFDGDEGDLKLAREDMNEEGVQTFQWFLGVLVDKGWLK